IELMPKRLELLSQVKVIAVLVNPNSPMAQIVIRNTQEAERAKGVQLPILRAGTEGEIETAFASLVQLKGGAIVVAADSFFFGRREQLVALASRYALPSIYNDREFTASGGLISYGIDYIAVFRQGRHLRRKDPQRHEAGRFAGPAADQIRAGDQP